MLIEGRELNADYCTIGYIRGRPRALREYGRPSMCEEDPEDGRSEGNKAQGHSEILEGPREYSIYVPGAGEGFIPESDDNNFITV